MAYSNDDIRKLCLDIDMILVNGDKYNDRVTTLEDLQNRLRRKAKFKDIDLQSKCEGGQFVRRLTFKECR